MYEIFVLWKGEGGGLEPLYFTFFALVADSVLSLAVFAELMRVGTVLLQAIALSAERFEEISPIDISFIFVRGACFLPWSAWRWTAI